MTKGLTYYRLNSPYEGDITKNAGLLGKEVDMNFFTLEGRDIKSVGVDGNALNLGLMNGETICDKTAFNDFAKGLTFSFNQEKGELHIVNNDREQVLTGFTTEYNQGASVATDGTLVGNGKPARPLGVSPVAKTGSYRPVIRFIDTEKGAKLPHRHNLKPGDRFLVSYKVSDYGYLYDYSGVKNIAADLARTNSEWRIPSKEDWDNMLDAIEPIECDRNHSDIQANVFLGRFAGKFLKSKDFWKGCPDDGDIDPGFSQPPFPHHHHHHHEFDHCGGGCTDGYFCGGDDTGCIDWDGEPDNDGCRKKDDDIDPGFTFPGDGCCHPNPFPPMPPFHPMPDSPRGVDKFGFRATPAGYGDDGHHLGYFGERAFYWTSTNCRCTTAFAKRFQFDTGKVYQDIVPNSYLLSLRLVKDFDGTNYKERENILGQNIEAVILPSGKCGSAVWTAVNVALADAQYHPHQPNNGIGLTQTKKYFINEWIGNGWLSNEVSEGEKVVIEDAPNGDAFVEYIVKGQELVSVNAMVIDQVGKDLGTSLTGLRDDLEKYDQQSRDRDTRIVQDANKSIDTAVQAERQAREDTDHELLKYVNTNKESIHTLADADKALDSRVKALEDASGSGAEFDALKDKVKANTTQLDALDVQVTVLKKQAQTAADEAQTASAAVAKAIPDIENAVKVSGDATKALNDATAAVKAMQASVDANTAAIQDLTKRLTDAEAGLADLKKRMDAAEAEVAKKLDTTITTEQEVAGPVNFKMGAGTDKPMEDQF